MEYVLLVYLSVHVYNSCLLLFRVWHILWQTHKTHTGEELCQGSHPRQAVRSLLFSLCYIDYVQYLKINILTRE